MRAIIERIEEPISRTGEEQTFLIGIFRNSSNVSEWMLGQAF